MPNLTSDSPETQALLDKLRQAAIIPDINANVRMTMRPAAMEAGFLGETSSIPGDKSPARVEVNNDSKTTLLHELTHAIQQKGTKAQQANIYDTLSAVLDMPMSAGNTAEKFALMDKVGAAATKAKDWPSRDPDTKKVPIEEAIAELIGNMVNVKQLGGKVAPHIAQAGLSKVVNDPRGNFPFEPTLKAAPNTLESYIKSFFGLRRK